MDTTRPSIAVNDENLEALLRPSSPRKPVFEPMQEVESALGLIAKTDHERTATGPKPEPSAAPVPAATPSSGPTQASAPANQSAARTIQPAAPNATPNLKAADGVITRSSRPLTKPASPMSTSIIPTASAAPVAPAATSSLAGAPVTEPLITPEAKSAALAPAPARPAEPKFAVSERAPEKFQERYPSFGVSTEPPKSTATSKAPLIIGVVVVAVGLSAFLLRDKWMPSAKHTPPAPVATFPLQLELQPQGNGLINIRWNPDSPLITEAHHGLMVITERDQVPKTIALEPAQLKIGHLYFQSSADRVEFRLEVTDQKGVVSQESVMALSSAPDPAAPGAAPQSSNAQSASAKAPNAPGATTNAASTTGTRPADPAQPKTPIRTFTIPPPAKPSAQEGRVILPDPPPVVAGGAIANPVQAVRLPDAGGAPPQARPPAPAQPLRVGGSVQNANLIRRVTPVYPEMARKARVQGTVRFTAVIGKGGAIQDLQLVSGPSLLVQAAVDAVKQWVYRPTMLNGEPTEVITQIDVNFTLSQ